MVTQMTQKSSKMKHNHQQTIGVNCQIRSNHKLFNSLECDASIIYSKVDITQEPKLHKISTFDLISWMETWWKRTLVEANHNTRKRKSCNWTIFWRKWKSHSSTSKKRKTNSPWSDPKNYPRTPKSIANFEFDSNENLFPWKNC